MCALNIKGVHYLVNSVFDTLTSSHSYNVLKVKYIPSVNQWYRIQDPHYNLSKPPNSPCLIRYRGVYL